MKRILCLVALMAMFSGTAYAAAPAQDPPALAAALFPPVKGEINTPGAASKTFTEYADAKSWLDGYAKEKGVELASLGKSPSGNDIWAVRLPNPKAKLRMMVFARVHGNEPGSSEAALQFIHSLVRGDLKAARKDVEFLIIPFGNPDGSIANKRQTASGADINRDYTTNNQPETRILSNAFRTFDPHILVDLHEYTVWGRLGDKSSPFDLLIAGANEPNIPDVLVRHLAVYSDAVTAALSAKGMRGGIYELLSMDKESGKLKVAESATTFVSGKNFLGMPSRVSFLFEVRGIGLGNQHYERRTMAGYTALTAMLQTGIANADKTKAVLAQTKKELMAATKWELARKPKNEERMYPLTDAETSTIKEVPATFVNRSAGAVTATVDVPAAYIIPAARKDLVERLQYMGVTVATLKKPLKLAVDVQTIESVTPDGELYKGFAKQKVTTSVKQDTRNFAKGDFVVSTAQRNRLYLQVLEAASPSGFATLGVLGDKAGAEVPVFRVMKELPKGSF